jgi:hypothetical protein
MTTIAELGLSQNEITDLQNTVSGKFLSFRFMRDHTRKMFKFKVKVVPSSPLTRINMYWFKENLSGYYTANLINGNGWEYFFTDEDDAVLFKLAFG